MTVLVVGNAAHLDLILKADARPGDSGFGLLSATPSADGQWLEGGAAMTIALSIARTGTTAVLWHPLPVTASPELGLDMLAAEGVELGLCPRYVGEPVRSVIVYGTDWRLGWSRPPLDARFDAGKPILSSVTELVIAPVWGSWTDAALAWAKARRLPCTLVGFSDHRALSYQWHRIIVDHNQAQDLADATAEEWIITDGPRGARVLSGGRVKAKIDANRADVVDTTGAGDTFAGTLIGAIRSGADLQSAGKLAAARAAKVCEIWGSRPPKSHFQTYEG